VHLHCPDCTGVSSDGAAERGEEDEDEGSGDDDEETTHDKQYPPPSPLVCSAASLQGELLARPKATRLLLS